jgi:1-acyl-sn-glycerol-3-phosphate acyltransferase
MSWLRALAFVLTLAFFALLVAPLQFFARRRGWRICEEIQKIFCRTMNRVIGIEVIAHGALPGAPPRFIAGNHVSWTDILAIASLYPVTFLAKSEVARWPVLGAFARLQGTIFIDRARRAAIPAANAALARELKAGRDVVVFAEGTSTDGSKLLNYKASHFAMLQAAAEGEPALEISATPIAFVYAPRGGAPREGFDVGWHGDMSFLPHLWSLLERGGARCHVLFGAPLRPEHFSDRKTLAKAAEEETRALMTLAFSKP